MQISGGSNSHITKKPLVPLSFSKFGNQRTFGSDF
jgi:hypothetical protein